MNNNFLTAIRKLLPSHYVEGLGLLLLLLIASCRSDDEMVVLSTPTNVTADHRFAGFYLLNEGNMGSNKCTLDWYDAHTGIYHRNIFAERNPQQAQELGDVGNDLQQYGGKLYAVVNCSHLVEVMDLSARHIAQIAIPNCRYITFDDRYAYVSSYAGPVQSDPNARLGYVAKIDTATLQVVDECVVGYQPEETAVLGDKLYVANSGGYRAPNYDNTLSVIDLATFTEVQKIEVAPNLHRVRADKYGQLWVSSRGNYGNIPSRLHCISNSRIASTFDVGVSQMDIAGDTLFALFSDERSASYAMIDVRSKKRLADTFIPSDLRISTPYGLKANPTNGDIYITDAGNYVTPGRLHCIDRTKHCKWSVTTGDIPAHICIVRSGVEAAGSAGTADDRLSRYIAAVDEYVPAPGQFINTMPEATANDTPQSMARKCSDYLAANKQGVVSLGGFGGYITFHFDHPVANVEGKPDLLIKGNAIAGSAEPGIVMVSIDANGNGLPDDEWYELSGSADVDTPEQVDFGYEITYTRAEMQDIPWTDNRGNTGSIIRVAAHTQEYYPLWMGNQLTLRGTRLPDNATDKSGQGVLWVLDAFRYGYVDNHPNTDLDACSFDIDWAVDASRNPVKLSHADFIRVYSAQNQQCGWIGETSTEISGAEDLNYREKRAFTI